MAIVAMYQSWMTVGPDRAEVFRFDPVPAVMFLPERRAAHGFASHLLRVEPSVEWRIKVDGTPGVQVAGGTD